MMMFKAGRFSLLFVLPASCGAGAYSDEVWIKTDIAAVTAEHHGRPIRIEREQDPAGVIAPKLRRTSRRCPPFCIQPMNLPGGVETIGELGTLEFPQRRGDGDESVMIIDSRGPTWLSRGTIRSLMRLGNPPSKLKSYRGGMRARDTLGLNTVSSETQSKASGA